MRKEEMQGMMREMMAQMCANMTSDEKIDVMMGMMGKMKEAADEDEGMPAMGAEEGAAGMKEMMAKMMQGGQEQGSMMPEMMLKNMMPHCVKMMMPSISKDKRVELVSGMVTTLMEQASSGMSDEEKRTFRAKIADTINA